jgi:hypothetical protein
MLRARRLRERHCRDEQRHREADAAKRAGAAQPSSGVRIGLFLLSYASFATSEYRRMIGRRVHEEKSAS